MRINRTICAPVDETWELIATINLGLRRPLVHELVMLLCIFRVDAARTLLVRFNRFLYYIVICSAVR